MSQIISTPSFPESFYQNEKQAQSFLLLGQTELAKKNLEKGLEYFQEASILRPNDAEIHFQQGISLFDFAIEEKREKILLSANKKFKLASSLIPNNFETWQVWGTALSRLGKTYQEFHYFLEAEEKLKKAISLEKTASKEVLSDLYSEYAIVRAEIAKNSKEAYDWRICIESFEKTVTLSTPTDSAFWNEFGFACLELFQIIADLKLCIQAIQCFKYGLSYNTANYTGWKNLCSAMRTLYAQTHDEEHFFQVNQCFEACLLVHSTDFSLYLEWAMFLLESVKIHFNAKKLSSAIEKCKKAYTLNSQHALLLATWGEALALIGEGTDTLETIDEGLDKISQALEIDSESPLIWKSFGEALSSLGKYFDEPDYHYQAIEKFQTGLSIDRTQHAIWISIANSYALIGSSSEDIDLLKKSLYFYNKAIDLQPYISSYYFLRGVCLSKLGELTREETVIESAIYDFEKALHMQKNAIYLHPNWLFEYAKTLDLYADFFDEERHYHKAIEIFLHVLVIDPNFPKVHHHLGLAYSHLAELMGETQNFHRALHFFRLAAKKEEENDQILVDLGITFINIAEYSSETEEKASCYQEAESKLFLAAKSGNLQAYYQLACLFSLLGDLEKSMHFLKKADSFNALPSMEELLEDEWLDRTRSCDAFKQFLLYLERKTTLQEEF